MCEREAEQCSEVPSLPADDAPAAHPLLPLLLVTLMLWWSCDVRWTGPS